MPFPDKSNPRRSKRLSSLSPSEHESVSNIIKTSTNTEKSNVTSSHHEIESCPEQNDSTTSNIQAVQTEKKSLVEKEMEHVSESVNIPCDDPALQMTLEEVIQYHTQLSRKRNALSGIALASRPRKKNKRSSLITSNSIEDNWEEYVYNLLDKSPDFFTSKHALGVAHRKQNQCQYEKLVLNENNCHDIAEVYEHRFKDFIQSRPGSTVYSKFLNATGQFARMSLVLQKSETERSIALNELCHKGNVYKLLTNSDKVSLFITITRNLASSPTNTREKSKQLIILAKYAKSYFQSKNMNESAREVELVQDKLHILSNASNREARRLTSSLRLERNRKRTIMKPTHFQQTKSVAFKKLSGIKNNAEKLNSNHDIRQFLQSREGMIDKWCLNLLGLLMITCGGQRPQVYCQLQRVSKTKLQASIHECGNDGDFIDLNTLHEKRPRSLDLPFVPVPASLAVLIYFHIKHVLPILDLIRQSNQEWREEEQIFAKTCLLLHSKRGTRLSVDQISSSLRRCIGEINPELKSITSMDLRCSYATMMVECYRRKKFFKNKSEDQFLTYLSSVMNTSKEQLRSCYIQITPSSYSNMANFITEFLVKILHNTEEVDEHGSSDEDWEARDNNEFANIDDFFQ